MSYDERINFLGVRIPPEVKYLAKNINKYSTDDLEKLIKVALKACGNTTSEEFKRWTDDIDEESVQALYPGILVIIKKALRLPKRRLDFERFCCDMEEIRVPKKYSSCFSCMFSDELRENYESQAEMNKPRLQSLKNARWRLDVGISTTSLHRVLEPSILMQMETKDNTKCEFEISKEKFHQLRYAVAQVLDNMQQLEKRSVFKIEV